MQQQLVDPNLLFETAYNRETYVQLLHSYNKSPYVCYILKHNVLLDHSCNNFAQVYDKFQRVSYHKSYTLEPDLYKIVATSHYYEDFIYYYQHIKLM